MNDKFGKIQAAMQELYARQQQQLNPHFSTNNSNIGNSESNLYQDKIIQANKEFKKISSNVNLT